MAVRISQLLAIIGGIKTDTGARLAALQANITTEALVNGFTKTYRPAAEPRPGEPAPLQRPAQGKRVQVTVDNTLAQVAAILTRQFDLTLTLDNAKTEAFGDVVINGQVLLPQVPSDHLLYLEGRLAELHAFTSNLPILDPAEEWNTDGTETGQYRTRAIESTSNETVHFNHVKAPATEHHPAQVEIMKRDEVVGYWTTVKFSGAMDARAKRRLLDRIIQLREAVRFAREEANTTEVTDQHEGDTIFGWLLG